MNRTEQQLTLKLKEKAFDLGFALAGVVAAAEPQRLAHFHGWLASGYAGQMHYLEQRKDAYAHPTNVLDGCRSMVMLAMPYPADKPVTNEKRNGKVARYAANLDYHDLIHDKLKSLKQWLLEAAPQSVARGIVDTAPLLEREFAEAAGLGWVGKNTLLLNRDWGSYFFLAALLTDLELVVDEPSPKGYCGTCTACLEACPTEAFPAPYILDANKCISYLTIEHRDHISPALAEQFSGWAFGCDICQEVCPWNRKTPEHIHAPELCNDNYDLDIVEMLKLDDESFRQRFRKTPLWRSKRRGILRNAILVAGQNKMAETGPLILGLLSDIEPLVRAAACWAVLQLQPTGWKPAIQKTIESEADPETKAYMQGMLAQ